MTMPRTPSESTVPDASLLEAIQSLSKLERLAHLAVEAYGNEGTPRDVHEHAERVRRTINSIGRSA